MKPRGIWVSEHGDIWVHNIEWGNYYEVPTRLGEMTPSSRQRWQRLLSQGEVFFEPDDDYALYLTFNNWQEKREIRNVVLD